MHINALFFEMKMLSTSAIIAIVIVGVILIIGIVLSILIKKKKIRLHGGYFHVIDFDDESVNALNDLFRAVFSVDKIVPTMRDDMIHDAEEYMGRHGLAYRNFVVPNEHSIKALIDGYWSKNNQSTNEVIDLFTNYADCLNDAVNCFNDALEHNNMEKLKKKIWKMKEDLPSEDYCQYLFDIFPICKEACELFNTCEYDDDDEIVFPYDIRISGDDLEDYDDEWDFLEDYLPMVFTKYAHEKGFPSLEIDELVTKTDNGKVLTTSGKELLAIVYQGNNNRFYEDRNRAAEDQKIVVNNILTNIEDLVVNGGELTIKELDRHMYEGGEYLDSLRCYNITDDLINFIFDKYKTRITEIRERLDVRRRIDLSNYKPPAYNPNTWESDNPYTDNPADATLIYPYPFSGVKGFQIQNGEEGLERYNKLTIRKINDPSAVASLTQINKDIAERLPEKKLNMNSVHVSYEEGREMDPNHTVCGYKGVLGKYINEMKGETMAPFTLLTAGFELTNLTRGFASGVGAYFSPDLRIAGMYGDGGVIYKYDIEYKKYYYSFIRRNISDHVLEFITHNFDKAYIAFPSDRAIKLWCCLSSVYLEETINERYHSTPEQLKRELIDEYNKIYDDKEMEAAFDADDVHLNHAYCNDKESARIRENYYNNKDIDLIISYKHGGDMLRHHKEKTNKDLINNVPCYEIVLRKGGKMIITDILLLDEK